MNLKRMLGLAMAVCLTVAVGVLAQDTTTTEVSTGTSATTTTTVSGTIVYAAGNDLVLKLDSGELKHFQVPPEATATTEDGSVITMKEAKPGIRLTRTIISTTTPKTVETIRTIKGTVWHVQPPSLVILTLPEGNKVYRVPEGQKFNINGTEANIWDLQKGQEVTATVVRTVPETVTNLSQKVSAKLPPPPPPPPMPPLEGVLLVEEVQVAELVLPPDLPQTGSMVPLLGLVGLVLTGASLGLKLIRS